MGPDHERWEDTAGTYVLGALPDDEKRAATRRTWRACPACRAEADELSVAASLLPVSPPAMKPPPALKARIMAEVEREAALLASAGEPRPRARGREGTKRRWSFRLPMPAVALACSALLAGRASRGARAVRRDVRQDGPVRTSTLPQASAELEMTDDGATIVANNLPAPPSGKTYMVWLKRPGKSPEPTSALFTPRRDGSATASVTGDMDGVEAVLVNTEPLGGSTTPTSEPSC